MTAKPVVGDRVTGKDFKGRPVTGKIVKFERAYPWVDSGKTTTYVDGSESSLVCLLPETVRPV